MQGNHKHLLHVKAVVIITYSLFPSRARAIIRFQLSIRVFLHECKTCRSCTFLTCLFSQIPNTGQIYMYTFSALSCHSITSNRVHPFHNILCSTDPSPLLSDLKVSIPAPLLQTPPRCSLPGESRGSGTALSACTGGWRGRGG